MMTILNKNTPRDYELGEVNELPVELHALIYEGAAVGLTSAGYVRPLEAGDIFVGFCEQAIDNHQGSAGAQRVRVRSCGKLKLTVENADQSAVGKPVYAKDDATFSLIAENNSCIGYVYRYEHTGQCVVAFAMQNHFVSSTI